MKGGCLFCILKKETEGFCNRCIDILYEYSIIVLVLHKTKEKVKLI